MSDWTTARVVRDCESWLWARVGHRMWMQMDGDMRIGTQGLAKLGPLTPVLDADGLPVVRTVGDLTARHVGRTVTVEGHTGELYEVLHRVGMTAIVMGDENDHDLAGPAWFPASGIETPCELLPEGDA